MKKLKETFTAEGKVERTFLGAMLALITILIMGMIAGCSNTVVSPESEAGGNFSLSSVASQNDNSSLVINTAKVLLKNIHLKEAQSNDVRDIKVGPIAVIFDVSGQIKIITNGIVPAGTYDRIRFNIHKPEDFETPPDPEFREGPSGNQRFSFIVKGTYNGNPFVFKSRRSASHEIIFPGTVSVNETSASNLTIKFNPYEWFTVNGALVNPMDENFEDEIEDNLRNSMRSIFIDNDKNGIPDTN